MATMQMNGTDEVFLHWIIHTIIFIPGIGIVEGVSYSMTYAQVKQFELRAKKSLIQIHRSLILLSI